MDVRHGDEGEDIDNTSSKDIPKGFRSMVTPLRIYPAGPAAPPARKSPAPAPVPVQYRIFEIQTESGVATDTFLLWRNEDGARCDFCDPALCNFAATAEGYGTCRVRSLGPASRAAKLFGG